jgi:hypothetical protein
MTIAFRGRRSSRSDEPHVSFDAIAIVWLVLPEVTRALTRTPARCCAMRATLGNCLAADPPTRYVGVVRTPGGLKLALEGACRDDRRVRFANVSLSAARAKDDVALVTDSQGRMRYRLSDGEYILRLTDGHESRFTVRDGRWTSVRIRLS